MLILLWGLGTEGPLTAVREELHQLGLPTVLIDQHDVLTTEIHLSVGEDIHGSVQMEDEWVDLSEVTAAYVRPYDSRCLPVVEQAGEASAVWRHAATLDETLMSWTEVTPALVVNRLGAMASNGSKPYQLELIRESGFKIPETLVTTDPVEAQIFWKQYGTVIYKSVSSIRSIVSCLTLEHRERLADITHCPTQFQRYIPGRDHRVHVVGSEVFPSEVICDAIDYRYPSGNPVRIRACDLPYEIEERCRRLAAALQLPVAGIDLRRSPDGEWYCFEVNPSPVFTYYQEETGQPIGSAIARLLAHGAREQDFALKR
jgi:hypothetical protein